MKVKTINGSAALIKDRMSESEYDKISALFRGRATAMGSHSALLKADASNPDESAFHGYARHGPQTGWESQLVRLVTGRTPDQPEDPYGAMDAVTKYETKNALPKRQQGKIRYAKADSTGAFFSAEVETTAIQQALAKSAPLQRFKLAETSTKKSTTTNWEPYSYIDVILPAVGACAGVSFVRDKRLPKVPANEAVAAIKDFINRAYKSDSDPDGLKAARAQSIIKDAESEDSGHAFPNYRAYVKRNHNLRFPSMQELLDFLHVRAVWMTHVNVCLRRIGTDWKVHTAYAVGSRLPSDADIHDKDARHKDELEKRINVTPSCGPSVKSGKWTGKLKAEEGDAPTYINPASLL